MTTAREIMTPSPQRLGLDDPVTKAAEHMAADDIGALPVCDGDGHLVGILTDRDIVLRVVSEGRDPASTKVSDVVQRAEVVTIGADDPAEEAIRTMKDHAVRRLPVVDGQDLVGMVSQADIARALPDARVGDLVGAISSAPSNN
jgi:CBS domain-containing protein